MGCTVKSVAALAGVSTGTVSRVLNNHPKVSEANKRAVEQAMARLNYRPDPVARSLRKSGTSGRIWTGNIGVMFPNTTTAMLTVPFMARMIQGVQCELSENGYHLLISNTTDSVTLPDIVRNEKVEGILIHGDLSAEVCHQLSMRVPAVSMGWNNVGLPLPMVNVDNRIAIISAMRYLVELGHRRIGFITRNPEHKDFAERLMGYREALEILNLEYDPELERMTSPGEKAGPRIPKKEPPVMDDLIEPLLKLSSPPTALIVTSDWHSIGVYRALKRRGIRIPEEMSIIGFDNDEQICHSLNPPLTSLDYPSEKIGRHAVQMLLRQIKSGGNSSQATILVQSELVERNSCAQPKP